MSHYYYLQFLDLKVEVVLSYSRTMNARKPSGKICFNHDVLFEIKVFILKDKRLSLNESKHFGI